MQAVMAKVITLCLLSIGVFTACCFATPLDDYVNVSFSSLFATPKVPL
jgi:hypothetical protein